MIGDAAERVFEEQLWIDHIALPVQRAIQAVLRRAPLVARVLQGELLGHPLHPALVTIPIGAWSCTMALDLLDIAGFHGLRPGADGSLAIGLLGAVAAAAAGLADWSTTQGIAMRVGFIHGATNMVAAGLYGASLFSRVIGLRGVGITLSTVGLGLAGISGWLGGEMIYRYCVGVFRYGAGADARCEHPAGGDGASPVGAPGPGARGEDAS